MENIKEYGDLSEKELLEFLWAIESEDEDLAESQKHVREIEDNLEVNNQVPDIPEKEVIPEKDNHPKIRIEDRPDFYNLSPAEHGERTRKYAAERRLLKTRLQRAAFDQSEIPLTKQLTPNDIRTLITILTKDKRDLMFKYEKYAHKRLTDLLRPLIPKSLRRAYTDYPQSVLSCPGFMYRVVTKDQKYTFFTKPDIPYYFEQGTELEQLKGIYPPFITKIDQAIISYYQCREELFEKEVSIASRISKHVIHTYFDLLKFNVMWFNALYEHYTGKVLCLTPDQD